MHCQDVLVWTPVGNTHSVSVQFSVKNLVMLLIWR